jgi:hypothetical protein
MSEDEVARMAHAEEFFQYEDDDEDDDDEDNDDDDDEGQGRGRNRGRLLKPTTNNGRNEDARWNHFEAAIRAEDKANDE